MPEIKKLDRRALFSDETADYRIRRSRRPGSGS